jgi:hypothetical protein
LVVPRSMPMIFAMWILLSMGRGQPVQMLLVTCG